MNQKTALVTGASTGIGRQFAHLLASEGYGLIAVARRGEHLKMLAQEIREKYAVRVHTFVADLSKAEERERLATKIKDRGDSIDLLVNNAGFGKIGQFEALELGDQLAMIEVNISALTYFARLLLPDMIDRGVGGIINIASTAGFQPGPFMAVYYASKAYVLSLSEALSEECRGSGVTVTCLCPGITETEFFFVAGFEKRPLYRLIMMDAALVARVGYEGWRNGKVLVIAGFRNKLLVWISGFLPRIVVRRMLHFLQRQSISVSKKI